MSIRCRLQSCGPRPLGNNSAAHERTRYLTQGLARRLYAPRAPGRVRAGAPPGPLSRRGLRGRAGVSMERWSPSTRKSGSSSLWGDDHTRPSLRPAFQARTNFPPHPHFVGRAEELRQLTASWTPPRREVPVVISAINARRDRQDRAGRALATPCSGRSPDGQLYVNCESEHPEKGPRPCEGERLIRALQCGACYMTSHWKTRRSAMCFMGRGPYVMRKGRVLVRKGARRSGHRVQLYHNGAFVMHRGRTA